jgi:hypothetical protein
MDPIGQEEGMLTETVLFVVFTSHMSVMTAFPWLAVQSIALTGLQTPRSGDQPKSDMRIVARKVDTGLTASGNSTSG